ncbi:MAG: signal peptidase I [Candidatus Dojkabacteria bacterium]
MNKDERNNDEKGVAEHDISGIKERARYSSTSTLADSPNAIVEQHYARTPRKKESFGVFSVFSGLILGIFKSIFDFIQVIVISLAIFVVFYLFIISPHTIDGVSMEPNFCNGDLILADKLTPRFNEYKRGDVIVFKHDEVNDYIKRIIGVEGDTVRIEGGKVYRNGEMLREDYLPPGRQTLIQPGDQLREGEEYTVPEGHFFVLGDNRMNSSDSRRYLAINPDGDNIIKGRVRFVIWPVSHARVFEETKGSDSTYCGRN